MSRTTAAAPAPLPPPLPPLNPAITGIRNGLPVTTLDFLSDALGIDRTALLDILGVSERTVQRKESAASLLSPAASDRLSRIERIFNLAGEIFGDTAMAATWLKRPSRALGNEVPLRLLDTDMGTQFVERELRQIQFGFVF